MITSDLQRSALVVATVQEVAHQDGVKLSGEDLDKMQKLQLKQEQEQQQQLQEQNVIRQ